MFEQVSQSVVAISFPDGRFNGTGFFISSDGYLLTCWHVIEPMDINSIHVRLPPNGTLVPALYITHDVNLDIAILKTPGAIQHSVMLGSQFTPGDSGWSFGFKCIEEFSGHPIHGIITGEAFRKRDLGHLETLVLTHADIQAGMSGAPLLNERTGYVIGIITSAFADTGTGYATKISDIGTVWEPINDYIVQDKQYLKNRLILNDLGVTSYLWETCHYLQFTLSNPGDGIFFVDRFTLNVLRAVPCESIHAPCEGKILVPFEFEILLTPEKASYIITEDFFVYGKGDIDLFKLKLTSNQNYSYEIQVQVEWHSEGENVLQKIDSKIHTISFQIHDIVKAINVLENNINSNSDE